MRSSFGIFLIRRGTFVKSWPSRRPCERRDSPKAHAAYHWAATLDQLPQQWQLAGKNRTAKYRGTRQHAAAEGNAVPVREQVVTSRSNAPADAGRDPIRPTHVKGIVERGT